MKSNLINYTDVALKKVLIEGALRVNPLLQRGDDFNSSASMVQQGRIAREEEPKIKTIQLDRTPDYFSELPKAPAIKMISVGQPIKIMMRDVEEGNFDALKFQLDQPTFLHFYSLSVPHRGWLEEYEVGQDAFMSIIDNETFMPIYTNVKLTQEIMDEHSYVHIRFALST